MVTEKFSSCRLVDDEINYLKKYWDGKFSDYVHNSIKRDIKQIETNKQNQRTQLFKDFSIYVILMGFGAIFFIFGIRSITIGEMLISFVLGLFMFIFGIIGGLIVALQSTRRNTNRKH